MSSFVRRFCELLLLAAALSLPALAEEGTISYQGRVSFPADAEYIDIASITEEQMTVLMTEAEELLSMFGF